jgi:hypothetical protein
MFLDMRNADLFTGTPAPRTGRDEFGWHLELPIG